MKTFVNYKDAVQHVRQYLIEKIDQTQGAVPGSWDPGAKKDTAPSVTDPWLAGFSCGFGLFYLPGERFLGFFDKLSVEKSWREEAYTFMRAEKLSKRQFRQLREYVRKADPKGVKILLRTGPERPASVQADDSGTMNVNRVWTLVQHVFSDAFVSSRQLSEDSLASRLEALKSVTTTDIKSDDDLPVFRLEENREDLRIVLLVMPHDLDVKLTYTGPVDKGILNPATAYFTRYDNGYDMSLLEKHNNVSFIEKQGWPSYPKAQNNIQRFSIDYGCFGVKGTAYDILASSGRRQLRALRPILRHLYLHAGLDSRGKYGEPDVDELALFSPDVQDAPVPVGKKIRQFIGTRHYAMPLYDIVLSGKKKTYLDDDDKEFTVAGISVTVIPFVNCERPKDGIYLHDIVYQAGK